MVGMQKEARGCSEQALTLPPTDQTAKGVPFVRCGGAHYLASEIRGERYLLAVWSVGGM